MPDVATVPAETRTALAGRVASLARLIEAHPAFDLLAEYEAVFLDRHPAADEAVDCLEHAAMDLLGRIDAVIATLSEAAPADASAATVRPDPPGRSLPPSADMA